MFLRIIFDFRQTEPDRSAIPNAMLVKVAHILMYDFWVSNP